MDTSLQRIRVLVADDHPVVRFGITNAVKADPTIDLVGEAANGNETLQLVEKHSPDVVLLDVEMPGLDGLSVTEKLREKYPHIRILVLSAYTYDRYIFEVLAKGASGYLVKDDALDQVTDAVHAVARGETWLSPKIASKVIRHSMGQTSSSQETLVEPLTDREMEVLRLMAQGLSNTEIAEKLYVAERTVRFHVSNIFGKLQTDSRIEAVVKAIRLKLLEA